jgi:single-strand DNA-binding protein
MYALKNRVQLIGYVGNPPEAKKLETGQSFVRFSLATNARYKNKKNETVTETQWHNLIAWNKIADIAIKFLQKGSEVAVEGKLINQQYIDKEGIQRYITVIQVSELLVLGSKET